jgi:hypothetical protein
LPRVDVRVVPGMGNGMSWEPVWVKDATGAQLTPIRAALLGGLTPATLRRVLLSRVVSALSSPITLAIVQVGAGLLGCSGAPAPPPPVPAIEANVAGAASAAPTAPPVAALPFHMPCAADDVTGCTHACDDGFVEDCVTLGAMYLDGAGVTVDRERAVGLFQTACGKDSARGCMRLADAYHAGIAGAVTGKSPSEAHVEENALYRRACEGGANLGCVVAGRALVAGHGVDRDPAQAAVLFGRVCDRGNAEACLELGKLVRSGEGAKKSPERAVALFHKACGLGLAEACLHADPKGEEHTPR